jgi:hypothetical protein
VPARLPQVLIARNELDSYFWLNLLLTLLAWLPGVAHAMWVLCSKNPLGESVAAAAAGWWRVAGEQGRGLRQRAGWAWGSS